MRNYLKMAFLFVTVCGITIGCDKTDDPKTQTTNDLKGSVLSGTITSLTSGKIDSVLILLSQEDVNQPFKIMGKGAISAASTFSISLPIPESKSLTKIALGEEFVGTISDTNAIVSENAIQIFGVKNGNQVGMIMKSNFSTMDSIDSNAASFAIVVYCDRSLTVSGLIETSETQSGVTLQDIQKNNFTLAKGWNELVYTQKITVQSATKVTHELSLSNYTTNDLKWRFFEGQSMQLVKKRNTMQTSQNSKIQFRQPLFFKKL